MRKLCALFVGLTLIAAVGCNDTKVKDDVRKSDEELKAAFDNAKAAAKEEARKAKEAAKDAAAEVKAAADDAAADVKAATDDAAAKLKEATDK